MILTAICEGNSLASISRMFQVNKITLLRLLSDAGSLAKRYHDEMVRGLDCERVQVDELWSFVYAKNRNVKPGGSFKGHGDQWVWVAMDADSKIVIAWRIGGRDTLEARPFMADVASRLINRIQLTADGLSSYLDAVPKAFGDDVDFAQLIKLYGQPPATGPERRYSPGECIGCRQKPVTGNPDPAHISTSYIERQNLSVRMQSRRFTRLTNAFSKRLENHGHAVALHYLHFNFIRRHQTLKTTPAVAAGIASSEWTMMDFVQLLEREEDKMGKRLTDYKPAKKSAN